MVIYVSITNRNVFILGRKKIDSSDLNVLQRDRRAFADKLISAHVSRSTRSVLVNRECNIIIGLQSVVNLRREIRTFRLR